MSVWKQPVTAVDVYGRHGVLCPDCRMGYIFPGDRCSCCMLSWEDLEAAAQFFDRMMEARRTQ